MATRKTKNDSIPQAKPVTDPRAGIPVEYLTFDIEDFAALRRVSRSHIYDLIGAGKLKTVKEGRRTLIPGSEIVRTAKEQSEAAA